MFVEAACDEYSKRTTGIDNNDNIACSKWVPFHGRDEIKEVMLYVLTWWIRVPRMYFTRKGIWKEILRQSKRRDRSSQGGIQRLIEEGESSSVPREGSSIANGIGCPLSPTFVSEMIRNICSIDGENRKNRK